MTTLRNSQTSLRPDTLLCEVTITDLSRTARINYRELTELAASAATRDWRGRRGNHLLLGAQDLQLSDRRQGHNSLVPLNRGHLESYGISSRGTWMWDGAPLSDQELMRVIVPEPSFQADATFSLTATRSVSWPRLISCRMPRTFSRRILESAAVYLRFRICCEGKTTPRLSEQTFAIDLIPLAERMNPIVDAPRHGYEKLTHIAAIDPGEAILFASAADLGSPVIQVTSDRCMPLRTCTDFAKHSIGRVAVLEGVLLGLCDSSRRRGNTVENRIRTSARYRHSNLFLPGCRRSGGGAPFLSSRPTKQPRPVGALVAGSGAM